jgi:hypothetical protein
MISSKYYFFSGVFMQFFKKLISILVILNCVGYLGASDHPKEKNIVQLTPGEANILAQQVGLWWEKHQFEMQKRVGPGASIVPEIFFAPLFELLVLRILKAAGFDKISGKTRQEKQKAQAQRECLLLSACAHAEEIYTKLHNLYNHLKTTPGAVYHMQHTDQNIKFYSRVVGDGMHECMVLPEVHVDAKQNIQIEKEVKVQWMKAINASIGNTIRDDLWAIEFDELWTSESKARMDKSAQKVLNTIQSQVPEAYRYVVSAEIIDAIQPVVFCFFRPTAQQSVPPRQALEQIFNVAELSMQLCVAQWLCSLVWQYSQNAVITPDQLHEFFMTDIAEFHNTITEQGRNCNVLLQKYKMTPENPHFTLWFSEVTERIERRFEKSKKLRLQTVLDPATFQDLKSKEQVVRAEIKQQAMQDLQASAPIHEASGRYKIMQEQEVARLKIEQHHEQGKLCIQKILQVVQEEQETRRALLRQDKQFWQRFGLRYGEFCKKLGEHRERIAQQIGLITQQEPGRHAIAQEMQSLFMNIVQDRFMKEKIQTANKEIQTQVNAHTAEFIKNCQRAVSLKLLEPETLARQVIENDWEWSLPLKVALALHLWSEQAKNRVDIEREYMQGFSLKNPYDLNLLTEKIASVDGVNAVQAQAWNLLLEQEYRERVHKKYPHVPNLGGSCLPHNPKRSPTVSTVYRHNPYGPVGSIFDAVSSSDAQGL